MRTKSGKIAWLSQLNGNVGSQSIVMENVEPLGGGIEGRSGKAEEGGGRDRSQSQEEANSPLSSSLSSPK